MVMDMKVTVVCLSIVPKWWETTDAHPLNSHCNNWNGGSENMQFHRVPYLGDMRFLIYNRQFVVNTNLLILHMTNRVSCITTKPTTSRTAIVVPSQF